MAAATSRTFGYSSVNTSSCSSWNETRSRSNSAMVMTRTMPDCSSRRNHRLWVLQISSTAVWAETQRSETDTGVWPAVAEHE